MRHSTLTLLALGPLQALAANCYYDKAFKNNEPAEAITQYLRSQIGGICNDGKPSFGSDKLKTGISVGGVIFHIQRDQESTDLSACLDAFNNILDQCTSGSLWGGEYDWIGSKFTIENLVSLPYKYSHLKSVTLEKDYDSGTSPLQTYQFSTWVRQIVEEYKKNEDDDHRKEAAAAASAAAACKYSFI